MTHLGVVPRSGYVVEHGNSVEGHDPEPERLTNTMNILLIVIAVIAIVLLFTGGFVSSLNFLLWVGLILLVFAVIVFLVRMISGNRRV